MVRTPVCPQCHRPTLMAARTGIAEQLSVSVLEPDGLRVTAPPARNVGGYLDRLFTLATTASLSESADLASVNIVCTNQACGLRMAGTHFLLFWRTSGSPTALD